MQQEQAGTAKPRMPRSLLDPSNLPVLNARNQTPRATRDVPAEVSSNLTGRAFVRRALHIWAITGKWQLSLARRLYSAAASSLAASGCSDVEVSTHVYEHVVREGFRVLGHIVSNGEVAVMGEVQGNIYCKSLMIGRTAHISGDVVAKDVVVQGRVTGAIHAERLALQSTCYVVGEIHHHAIKIEQGACFEGKSRRSERPISIAAIDAAPSEARDAEIELAICDTQPQTALLAA